MPPTARRDRWCAVGLGVVALAYLHSARAYPLDTLAAPGPGVFPLAAGVTLLVLALWQLLTARPTVAATEPVGSLRAPLLACVALVAYAAALPVLGFTLASLGLVFVTARLMGPDGGWWRPALLALGVTLASRVLFVTWLGVPLP
jgi:hypothetical protein